MSKKTTTQPKSEISPATVNFVKDLCTRISQALEQIDDICTEQLEPKPQSSRLGYLEGIGLFSYVKSNQEQLKEKYPAFTDNQIVSILMMKWQNLTNDAKVQFCSKLNLNKLAKSKKFAKLNKKGEKLYESISNSQKYDNPRIDSKVVQNQIHEPPSSMDLPKEKQLVIEDDLDQFFDEPCSKRKPDYCLQEIQEKESEHANNNNMDLGKLALQPCPVGDSANFQIGVEIISATNLQKPGQSVGGNLEVLSCNANDSIIPLPSQNQPESLSLMQSAQDSQKSQKLFEAEENCKPPEEMLQEQCPIICEEVEKATQEKQAQNNQHVEDKTQETPVFPTVQLIQPSTLNSNEEHAHQADK